MKSDTSAGGLKLIGGVESLVTPSTLIYPGGVPILRPPVGATISYLAGGGKLKTGLVLSNIGDELEVCPGVGKISGGLMISVTPTIRYSVHLPWTFVYESDEVSSGKAWLMSVLCNSVSKSSLRVAMWSPLYRNVCEELHMHVDYDARNEMYRTLRDGEELPDAIWRWR